MKTKIKSIFLLFPFLLTSCVTHYQDVESSEDHASITFTKSYSRGYSYGESTSMVEYYVYPDNNCKKPERAAFFSWMTGEDKTRLIAASKPFMVHATLDDFTASSYNESLRETCATVITFTPEKDSEYTISMSGEGNDCFLDVSDNSTNAPPLDIQRSKPESAKPKCEE